MVGRNISMTEKAMYYGRTGPCPFVTKRPLPWPRPPPRSISARVPGTIAVGDVAKITSLFLGSSILDFQLGIVVHDTMADPAGKTFPVGADHYVPIGSGAGVLQGEQTHGR